MLADFVALDEGGQGDHLLLGKISTVPGEWQRRQIPDLSGSSTDWGLKATVVSKLAAGPGQLRIRLATRDGRAPRLGQFLGTSAHLTGFNVSSGAAVHMHPMGADTVDQSSLLLVFHTEVRTAGVYVLFLQVPVDGFLHTLRLSVAAS